MRFDQLNGISWEKVAIWDKKFNKDEIQKHNKKKLCCVRINLRAS